MKSPLIISLLVCSAGHLLAQNSEVAKGNEEYEKKRYRNAESLYREAVKKDPKQYPGNYNLGSALYRQDKFEEAAQQYLNSSVAENNPEKQAKAYYNMGNALLKAEKYQESVEAYKKALRINPNDEDARYNLSYAMQKLKQQQQQQQQQNKDQKQDQQKQEQQKQDQQKQQDPKQQPPQQQQQQPQPKQPKMTKEEAERMLRALKNDEKELQKEKAKKYPVTNSNPEKNW